MTAGTDFRQIFSFPRGKISPSSGMQGLAHSLRAPLLSIFIQVRGDITSSNPTAEGTRVRKQS